jgi:antibiotic biosynthesis monooxygenase (ABM) superfamily enzyme
MMLRRYLTFERKTPGYLGTTIILPGGVSSNLRYIIRFTNRQLMKAWENSAESQNLLEEANNYSTLQYETSTGLETWFTLPNLKTLSQPPPPSKWKSGNCCIHCSVHYSSLSRSILGPIIGQWPILANAVIYTAVLVVSLTYFAMPIMSRLLRHWLYRTV